MVTFKFASSSTFRDLSGRSFCDAEVDDGSGGVNAIYSRPEVTNDVVSGWDVATFRDYICENLFIASFSSFRENRNQPLVIYM